jgi:hypothetical protein
VPVRRGKRLTFHRFQGDLLDEQDIADDELALWREAPLGDHPAGRIEFMYVHYRAVPDAIARAGVGAAA